MKYLLLLFLFAQDIPKGANVIKVKGVSFKEVATALLDNDYSFEKIDSNFQTIKTEYRERKDYLASIQLEVRVKDSVATIKGTWIASNIKFDIENQKWGNYKYTFGQMNEFALSFKKPVEYLKN